MQKNIILAGVGGQGILSIAYVIDNAALASGLHFKQAEVHGMAQRGGAVQSHLRYSDREVYSDIIPQGRADMIISVEPLEVMRYWHYLRPEGWVVASVTPYVNIPDYPENDALLGELAAFPRAVLVDSGQLARAAGNMRAQNMVVVGAAAPLLDLDQELLLEWVAKLFAAKGEKIVDVNQRAFRLGRAAGSVHRGLVEQGVPGATALALCRRMSPETLDPEQVPAWARLWERNPERVEELLAGSEPIPCDRAASLA